MSIQTDSAMKAAGNDGPSSSPVPYKLRPRSFAKGHQS
jgi:hypothetical protein